MIKVPFPGFIPNKHPTFWDSQKEYETQKVARIKGLRKGRGKGQEKSLEQAIAEKKTNQKKHFWFMGMHQIKIFYIFVSNLGEIDLFGNKIAFSVKLRPI